LKDTTSKTVTDMLVDGVENWVAKTWWVPWYTLAWKTWTSQIAYKWGYETWVGSTVASYAWFWPAEDPKFVIIVKLERSRVDIYWWTTASKMFAETAKYLFDYYGIPSKLKK
jgi:cell division protein FtsI/penicillin-binding protein 2